MNVRTNKTWAIKEVRKDGTNNYDVVKSNLLAETDILKKLDHPNLPNIIDILDDGTILNVLENGNTLLVGSIDIGRDDMSLSVKVPCKRIIQSSGGFPVAIT